MRKTLTKALIVKKDFPVLQPVAPDPSSAAVALDRPVCVVGSRALVHLPLFAPTISRAHALIVNDHHDGQGEVYVRDLASCNGLYVNGAVVREVVLHDGDQVKIGPFSFACASGFGGRGGAALLADLIAESSGAASPATMELHVAGAWLRDGKVTVSDRTAVIGLREDCDVILPGPGVDPAHAVVFRRGGKWYLRDLDSKSGTFVNGARVRETALVPGDGIRIGTAELRYVLGMTTGPARDVSALISPWESLDTDVPDATNAVDITPDIPPVETTAASGPAWLAGAPLATVMPSSRRPRALDLPRSKTDELAEPPSTAIPMPVESMLELLPVDLSDEEAIPFAPVGSTADANGHGDQIEMGLDGASELSSIPLLPIPSPDEVAVEEEEESGNREAAPPPVVAAAEDASFAETDWAEELAALEELGNEGSPSPEVAARAEDVAIPLASEPPNGHDIPLAETPVEETPVAETSAASAPANATAPAPVRRLTRLVGRLYRDVSALDSAWRSVRESRPEWAGDDPDLPGERPRADHRAASRDAERADGINSA